MFGKLRRKRLVVSRKKTVYLANKVVPDAMLAEHWELPATARRQQARNLGTDSSAGTRRAVATASGRIATALQRSKSLFKGWASCVRLVQKYGMSSEPGPQRSPSGAVQ